jgi:hypothetical protein
MRNYGSWHAGDAELLRAVTELYRRRGADAAFASATGAGVLRLKPYYRGIGGARSPRLRLQRLAGQTSSPEIRRDALRRRVEHRGDVVPMFPNLPPSAYYATPGRCPECGSEPLWPTGPMSTTCGTCFYDWGGEAAMFQRSARSVRSPRNPLRAKQEIRRHRIEQGW